MAYVSRDPFARTELHKREFQPHGATCAECGGLNARGQLFAYRVESDGGRKSDVPRAFCSVGCMRAYHS